MAQSIPEFFILQGRRGGNDEYSRPFIHGLLRESNRLHQPWHAHQESSIAHHACGREHLHDYQDSGDYLLHLLRQQQRPRCRNGRNYRRHNRRADVVNGDPAMPVKETKSPEITRAAERYLEQYGDPLVMNTYLKITILVLAGVCFMLGALIFKSQKALVAMKPLVIRINDVGHADAIDYRNYQYKPQEAENKYYLSRWATLYFQRNRYTIERDQTQALYFLNSDVQQAVIRQE